MRGDGDGWAFGPDGRRHWGLYGAAGLLLRAPGRGGRPHVLLQHRAAWSHEGGTWSIPGGARDSHEDAVAAAVREAHEECGLPAERIAVRSDLRTAGDEDGWSYTTVVADADEPLATVANHESVELAWLPEDEVAGLLLHHAFGDAWPGLRTRPLRLIVDMANLVGSRPDGWWRDRAGAAERMLDALERGLPRTVALGSAGFGWTTQVIAVTEGKARAAGDRGAIDVVRAPGSGDDTIAQCAEGLWEGVTAVVTADRGLRARLPADAEVISPGRVLGWL
ncbi:NUDIX hydrolase [Tomitella fengzijianii]|uniref:NUDIX hydrolase n=1 Tax=Tomitella fengzijianii TaxID=2597660 RepID=A0A516X5Q8_9ACTN|nr:NUDIX hydrolase [Tomitella fengzijianii]QDQ98384.1 NUDIX hydrolase [Tomitella fengzijianii]